jgi:hypothetical protein
MAIVSAYGNDQPIPTSGPRDDVPGTFSMLTSSDPSDPSRACETDLLFTIASSTIQPGYPKVIGSCPSGYHQIEVVYDDSMGSTTRST